MVGFSFIGAVSAGWFDFLTPPEEETYLTDEFCSADFEINASYENASVTLLESTPLVKDFQPDYEVGTVDLSEYGVDKGIVAVGQTHTTQSTCRIHVTLNVDLKNATLTELKNDSESIMGTPVEKELAANISTILDDAFNEKNNCSAEGMYFSFALFNEKSGKSETHHHSVDLENATYKDGILSCSAEFLDNSTEFDLTQIAGHDSTTSVVLKCNRTYISYDIQMPPISG